MTRQVPRRLVTNLVLLLFAVVVLPPLLSGYWTQILTSVAVYAIVALSLNLLLGRVGLVSLGQIAVLGLGAWVCAKLLFSTGLPFPVVLLLGGLITMVIGTIGGLPALRLRGLYLALITLMMAGAVRVILTATEFPNGGEGFLGHTETAFGNPEVRRPGFAESDPAYFRFTVIVAVLMFALAWWHVRSRPGRAWAAMRQSEPAALAAGINLTFYKLWAWALASFMCGVAGGLLAGAVGQLYSYQFPERESITLLAVVLMGGIHSLWGALVAGLLMRALPALLDTWGLPANLLIILFGIGILHVLTTAPAGLAGQVPQDLRKLGAAIVAKVRRPPPAPPPEGAGREREPEEREAEQEPVQ